MARGGGWLLVVRFANLLRRRILCARESRQHEWRSQRDGPSKEDFQHISIPRYNLNLHPIRLGKQARSFGSRFVCELSTKPGTKSNPTKTTRGRVPVNSVQRISRPLLLSD